VRVLLATGLTGFLGRRCVNELKQRGFEIHAITSREPQDVVPDVRWHYFDLLSGESVEALCTAVRPDALLHLAWVAEHPGFWASPLNSAWLRASKALVDAFVASGGSRIVAAGSCAEYASPAHGRYTEASAIAPVTPYGVAKAALHEYLIQLGRHHRRLSVAWGRIFFPYGPGEPRSKFIPAMARGIRSGHTLAIRDPNRCADYIHVLDAARALVAMLDSTTQGAVNIGTGRGISMTELGSIIGAILRGTTPRVPCAIRSEFSGDDMVADVARLRGELAFRWEFDLLSGVLDALGPAS